MNSTARGFSGESYQSQVQQMKPFNWWMNTSNLQMPFDSSLFLSLPDHTSSLSSSSASSSSSSSSPSHFHPNYFNPSSQLQYLPAYSYLHEHEQQEPTEAWNQSIFLGGANAVVGEGERCCSFDQYLGQKKVENRADPAEMFPNIAASFDVKQEMDAWHRNQNFHQPDMLNSSWIKAHDLPAFTSKSWMTNPDSSFPMSNSSTKRFGKTQNQDNSSKNASTSAISTAKKARLQPTNFKVRKEKLGDRIAALHQLVSPFGKTDTASVLAEATGYIRFLQSQIEALSSPYMGRSSSSCSRRPVNERGEDEPRTNYGKELRSRGLCLVPLSCTSLQVSNDTAANQLWASTFGSSFQ